MKSSEKKQKAVIIILGPSGSGKEIQAELLRKKFGVDCIGSGQLLRERGKKKDFTGRKILQTIDRGGLMMTPVIFKLWVDRFEKLKNKKNLKGFIMCGCPRKIFEARLIEETLKWYEWNKNVKVILIDISPKESVRRLTKRRMCEKCGKIIFYADKFVKIKECPVCGGEIIKRADDTVAGIKRRLAWFKNDVQPVINYYRKTGRLIKINGEQSIENVFSDILKALK